MSHVRLLKVCDSPEPVACNVKEGRVLTVGHHDEDDRRHQGHEQDDAGDERGLAARVRGVRLVEEVLDDYRHF